MLKWIARNKYKLMISIVGLYLVADGWQHRGIVRVLLPKTFPAHETKTLEPANKNELINTGKEWVQAVNSKERFDKLSAAAPGLECDVYFDTQKKIFDVHHDPDNSTGFALETLLQLYADKKLTASVWLDFKNLDKDNQQPALTELIRIRHKFGLTNKLLVESTQADLLSVYSDSGFYTSYYTPVFNPYLMGNQDLKYLADSLAEIIHHSKVDALSGYYFQYSFLHKYFPKFPVLTWAANDRYSLLNWLFKKKIAAADEVFIVLYPQ